MMFIQNIIEYEHFCISSHFDLIKTMKEIDSNYYWFSNNVIRGTYFGLYGPR